MRRILALFAAVAPLLFPVFANGFPLGLPPVESPVSTRVAPDNTTFYMCWNESAVPSAASANKTEQMLADKQMIPFFQKVRDALYVENPSLPPLADALLNVAYSKSACVYVDADGLDGALVCLGKDAASARKQLLAAMRNVEAKGTVKSEMTAIDKLKFCKLTDAKTGELALVWGFLGKNKEFLLVSRTEEGIQTILKNVKTDAPTWLVDVKNGFEVKNWSTFSYLDAEKYLNEVIQQETGDLRKYSELTYKLFGLNCMKNLASISGMTEEGVVQKAVLNMTDEWKDSVPGVLFEGKLTEKDLDIVPADVTFAIVGKTNLNKLVAQILKVLQESPDALPPDAAVGLGMVGMMATTMLQPLGDTWSVFLLPGTSEEQVNGCFVYSLSNPAMAKLMIPKLLEMAPGSNDDSADMDSTDMDADDSDSDSDSNSDSDSDNGAGALPGNIKIPEGGIKLPPGVTPEMLKEELKKKGIDPSQIPPGLIPGFGLNRPAVLDGAGRSAGPVLNPVLRGQNVPQMGGLGGLSNNMTMQPNVKTEEVEIAGIKGWKFVTEKPEASPILAIVRNVLVLAFNEASMEQYIKYDGGKSLASVPVVSRELGKYPSYIVHEDSALMLKAVMPTLVNFVKDPTLLPPEDVLQKYLARFSGVAYARENTIYVQSDHSFPLPDFILEFFGSVLFGTGENAALQLNQ